ncbi:hypothetical protein ACFOTA_21300 [Chitinophaga sp. GCM10012297]|uniref:Uncharacterized protein n=1 Tax=Chitinophaga chungangae TaxID=2821488 RepID=A0ABS3YKX4_9BACT|nr:hypothetical protein [Chitinophaga chungangae]MBO9154764.1 hypothetical protein [Chitinophaga chungangae]
MITEQYPISISYNGKVWRLPVTIDQEGIFYRITVDIEGTRVCFGRDHDNGLRPLNHQDDFDPQFLYLIATGVQQQRLTYNPYIDHHDIQQQIPSFIKAR